MSALAAAIRVAWFLIGCAPVCAAVILSYETGHPWLAVPVAGNAILAAIWATRRRARVVRRQAVSSRAGASPGGRIPCRIHEDGHLYGCPVTEWQPPGRSWS